MVRNQGFDLSLTCSGEICNTNSHLTHKTHHTISTDKRTVFPFLFLPFNSFLSSYFFANVSSALAYCTLNALLPLMKWERELQEIGNDLKMLFLLTCLAFPGLNRIVLRQ